jgi:hypothetical protein
MPPPVPISRVQKFATGRASTAEAVQCSPPLPFVTSRPLPARVHVRAPRRFFFASLRSVVARVAQRLPVALIPEQNRIATVWDDVIDALRRLQDAALVAHRTQWVLMSKRFRRCQPFVGIALFLSRAAPLIVEARLILPRWLTERAMCAWHQRHGCTINHTHDMTDNTNATNATTATHVTTCSPRAMRGSFTV